MSDASAQLLSCLEDVKLDLEELRQHSSAVMVGQAIDEIERAQSQLAQIARLAKHTLDGKMADGEEWNTLNAIYWHAIDHAEPDSETTKSSEQAKPCESTCPKCGSDDVNRRLQAEGSISPERPRLAHRGDEPNDA